MDYRNMCCLRSIFSCRVISGKIMMLVVAIVLNVAMLEAGMKDNLFSLVFYPRSPPQYHKNVKHVFFIKASETCVIRYDYFSSQRDLFLHVDRRGRQQEVWLLQTPAGKPLLNCSSSAPWSHPAEPCLLWQICKMWNCDVVFLRDRRHVAGLSSVEAGEGT